MIYIQSFFIWLYTKSPLICYNRNKAKGLKHCESSILYREGFILCYPSIKRKKSESFYWIQIFCYLFNNAEKVQQLFLQQNFLLSLLRWCFFWYNMLIISFYETWNWIYRRTIIRKWGKYSDFIFFGNRE